MTLILRLLLKWVSTDSYSRFPSPSNRKKKPTNQPFTNLFNAMICDKLENAMRTSCVPMDAPQLHAMTNVKYYATLKETKPKYVFFFHSLSLTSKGFLSTKNQFQKRRFVCGFAYRQIYWIWIKFKKKKMAKQRKEKHKRFQRFLCVTTICSGFFFFLQILLSFCFVLLYYEILVFSRFFSWIAANKISLYAGIEFSIYMNTFCTIFGKDDDCYTPISIWISNALRSLCSCDQYRKTTMKHWNQSILRTTKLIWILCRSSSERKSSSSNSINGGCEGDNDHGNDINSILSISCTHQSV